MNRPASSTTAQADEHGAAASSRGGEDEELALPSDTLALLDSFYHERDQQVKAFEDLRARASSKVAGSADSDDEDEEGAAHRDSLNDLSIDAFEEDWQASQFWYDNATAAKLAHTLLENVPPKPTSQVAIISAPSAYLSLLPIIRKLPVSERPTVHLLEFDDRFSLLPNFTAYDFIKPLALPTDFTQKFDAVLVDPPFLSEDCQTKMALTVRRMIKPEGKVVVCTGLSVGEIVGRLYAVLGVRRTTFEPMHRRELGNAFGCWSNCGVAGETGS